MASSFSLFTKNIKALNAYHPKVAKLLAQPVCANHIRIDRAANGAARLLVTTEAGAEVSLHDPTDPWWVAQVTAEQMAATLQGVTVLFGLELGYLTKALASKLPQSSVLVVYEADPAILLAALRETDLVEALSSPHVRFVVGRPDGLEDVCAQAIVDTGGPLQVVRYEPAVQLAPGAYGKRVQDQLTKLPSIIAATQNAIGGRGPQYVKSILASVPHIITAPGIRYLKGLCAGRTALLIAAGPSLEKNVGALHQAKGQAVLIAADTALRYLLARGIQPDFVVSADPQDETYRKFEGLEIPEQVALVYHPAANHQIVDHFPGPKFTMDTTIPAYQWLQSFWEPKGTLEQETMCQVHIGFNLAEWLGCSTIILVGQDLCFSEAGMHVKGGSYLSASEETDVVQRSHPAVDMYGQPVRTTPTFLNYKAILERKIAKFAGMTINATEGGLPIEGAEPARLSEAISTYCRGPFMPVQDEIQKIQLQRHEGNWGALSLEVGQRVQDLFRISRTARHVCKLLNRMAEKRRSSKTIDAEMKRLGGKVQRLTSLIPRYAQVRPLLHWMDISLERNLKADSRAMEQLNDPDQKHDRQIASGLRYYGGLARVAPVLRDYLLQLSHVNVQRRSPDHPLIDSYNPSRRRRCESRVQQQGPVEMVR